MARLVPTQDMAKGCSASVSGRGPVRVTDTMRRQISYGALHARGDRADRRDREPAREREADSALFVVLRW